VSYQLFRHFYLSCLMFSKLLNWSRQDEKKQRLPSTPGANWAFLGADMHSHFIPGIDDGAQTVEDSLRLVKAMKEMGYRAIVTTPHIMVDYYPNTSETIQNGLVKVQQAIREQNIDVTISAAAEYYIDESFMRLLDTEPLLTIHNKQVLVEFSMLYEPPMLFDVLFKMQAAGYQPIIAHPERYLFFHKNFHKYRELRDRGCLLQLNMLSITGYYGRHIKAIADDLLARQLYDYCGSDMHHEKHAAALRAMIGTKEYHTLSNYHFLNSGLIDRV
jgi:protein-tyrosine phosphatase